MESSSNCRPEGNQQPTTFVQAHTSNFKLVVQMLTGSSSSPSSSPESPKLTRTAARGQQQQQQQQRKHGFKLYERRGSLKNSLVIGSQQQRRMPEILSPSLLDFPKLALSPITPLLADPFCRSQVVEVEERAIAERGFYLHPSSPLTSQEPKLLPLFPLTSPRSS